MGKYSVIPKLRFPGFSGEWEVKKLGNLNVYVSDGNYGEMYPKASEMSESGVAFIRANNLKDGCLVWDDMKYISPELHAVLKSGHLKTGDTLVTTRGDIGVTAYVTPDFDDANINAQICLLRPISGIDNKYLFQSLQTHKSKSQFVQLQTGSALKQLPKGKLALLTVGIPSEDEQEKIAGFLTVVDERIAAMDKKVELLQQYKKGVMQKIFTKKLRFKDGNGNDYPGWQTKKLGGVVTIKTGKKDVNQGNPNGQYPFFTCAREHTYSDEYSFEGEAIMIAGNGEVGLCTYYEGKFEAYQRTYVLQEFSVPAKYLFIYLKSAFQDFAESQKQQGSMPYIKLATLQDFAVPIQSEAEQQKIADFLTSLDNKIDLEKTKLEQAKLFKKSLLQRMFV